MIIRSDPFDRFVEKTVRDYIEDHHRMPSEMKHALRDSPHVKKLINNLIMQFKNVQDVQLRRKRPLLKWKTFTDATHDMCEFFIQGFEGHVDRRRESEIDKYQRDHVDDDTNEMQAALEGKNTGAFEDMGLVIPEDQRDKSNDEIKEPIPNGRTISTPS